MDRCFIYLGRKTLTRLSSIMLGREISFWKFLWTYQKASLLLDLWVIVRCTIGSNWDFEIYSQHWLRMILLVSFCYSYIGCPLKKGKSPESVYYMVVHCNFSIYLIDKILGYWNRLSYNFHTRFFWNF